jgi:hypothetical protein
MSRTHPENIPEPSSRRAVRCAGGLLQTNLKAYLDGETSAVRTALVRWHLAQCAECREELRWLRRLGEDMKDIESARPRPELRARILANLPDAPPAPGIRVVHARPERARSPRLVPRLALAGGFATLLAFSAVFALHRSHSAAANSDLVAGVRNDLAAKRSIQVGLTATGNDADVAATVTYTPENDPNNALADRMFHESMTEIEREKRILGQDDWHRLLAQARVVARKTDRTSPAEMDVALAVSDIAVVRTHLPTWAKQEGVRLVTNDKPDSGVPDNTTMLPGRIEGSSPNVVAFYMPAERGPAFLGALKRFGQLSLMPPVSKLTALGSMKYEDRASSESGSEGQRKVVPAMPVTAESGAPTSRPSTGHVAITHETHNKAARYLVLTVLLQTAPRN